MEKFKPLVIIQTYEDRNANRDFSQKVSERLSSFSRGEAPQEKTLTPRQSVPGPTTSPPPPPPPLPPLEAPDHQATKQPPQQQQQQTPRAKQKAPPPPVPIKTSTLSFHQPPPCPTPDYDTLSLTSNSTLPRNRVRRLQPSQTPDSVEMDSLDSYRMCNPSTNNSPKPPNTYFQKSPNGSVTMRKARPVSVTIGEYPSGTTRRTPGKFDFLQNGGDEVDGKEQPITSQLAEELAQTLNRSNLRKRTESMENILNGPQIKNESNGSVRISVNNNLNKSSNHIEALAKALENRVTINIPSNGLDKKTQDPTPNGILKNANGQQS